MPIYEIKQFRGGLSDYEDKGISGAFKFASNMNIRKEIDSLSSNYGLIEEGLDVSRSPSASVSPSSSISFSPSVSASASASPTPSITPSSSPSASTSLSPSTTPSNSQSSSVSPSIPDGTVFEDLILWFVKASNGYVYGFGDAGHIYRRDGDRYWRLVYYDTNGRIRGAEEKPSSDGNTYLYWATKTLLMRKKLTGREDWNDVETVAKNLQDVEWHTMKQVNGALMIANGSDLAFVGYDNSYTNEAVNLIPGNIAKTLVERGGRTIIGTGRRLDATRSINSAIDTEVPLAQIGDRGEVVFANMTDSMPVKQFPGGGKTNPGGVTNEIDQVNFFEWEESALSWINKQSVGNMALFAVYGNGYGKTGIYSYGRRNKNHPFVMNLEYGIEADELGAVATVDGTTIVSYRDSINYGVKGTSTDTKAVAVYEGLDFKVPIKNPMNITNWKYAEIYTDPMPAGVSIEFWYRMDKNGPFVQAYMESGDATFAVEGENKGVFLIGAPGDVFEPRVVINPTGDTDVNIHRMRFYFE